MKQNCDIKYIEDIDYNNYKAKKRNIKEITDAAFGKSEVEW